MQIIWIYPCILVVGALCLSLHTRYSMKTIVSELFSFRANEYHWYVFPQNDVLLLHCL